MTCTRTINVRGSSHWSLLPSLFSKLPARRRGTMRVQTGAYPRRTCMRVASRTRATHLSLTRMYALTYTTVHLPLQRHAAIPCRRTLGSPGRPYVRGGDPLLLFFFLLGACGPTFPLSIGEHLVGRAAPGNRISKSRRLFEEEASESRQFPACE